MSCKSCKYFKKIRNYPFGECSNDDIFQYAESKEDLEGLGENILVIMGDGIPVVGMEYKCSHYASKKSVPEKVLSSTNDFNNGAGFKPPAQKKREGFQARIRAQR